MSTGRISRALRAGALALLASLALGAPARAQEELGGGEKQIAIEWAQTATKHYDLHHERVIPQETVDRVGRELEEILAQYVAIFRVKPTERLKVKFMDSPNTYQQEGGDKSPPGMYVERGDGEKYLLIQQMPFYELVPLVYHEAFHQYLAVYMEGGRVPTWFNEGMAMYHEGMQRDERSGRLDPKAIDRRKLRMVKDAVFTRAALSLADLVDATYEQFHDKEQEALHYAQSFALIDFLFQVKPGGKLVLDYAKELKKTSEGEKALGKLFGRDRKDLGKMESAFKRYVLAYEPKD